MRLNKPQLLETIRDTIYEVLEEEIDRRLKRVQVAGSKKRLTEAKAARAKVLGTVKARAAQRVNIQKRKQQLKEAYGKLVAVEKKLNIKKRTTKKSK